MNRSSRIMGAAVTAVFLASAAACSSSSSSGTPSSSSTGPMSSMTSGQPAAPSSADSITIAGFAFSVPSSVAPGATITVTNKDSVAHTVTADSGGAFDVMVPAGGTATFKAPGTAGSYAFHCTIHPSMHGTLVVSAG